VAPPYPAMIQLSPAAIQEILRLRSRRGQPDLILRLGVQPSGCLDWSYLLGFESIPQTGDRRFDCHGIQVVVDPASQPYLNGVTLDYSEDLMGGGFRFRNPNAHQTCGCGNSFSPAPPPAPETSTAGD